MGLGYSQSAPVRYERTDSSDKYENYWPEDLLIEILSFVPAADLLKNCALVCRQWRDIISEHGVWKRKCLRDGKAIPAYKFEVIPKNYYRLLCLYNPFGRNLLKNPCGEGRFEHWSIRTEGGDRWEVEDPPNGADPVPAEVGSTSCFATSYYECTKFQVINLQQEGVPLEVIDEVRPEIEVGEWHAARFDCGSDYWLSVGLFNAQMKELEMFKYGPYREEQWTGRAWSKVSHTFKDYPPGVRYIVFEHSGVDTQFWAGHYGSKMTGGYVRFKAPCCPS